MEITPFSNGDSREQYGDPSTKKKQCFLPTALAIVSFFLLPGSSHILAQSNDPRCTVLELYVRNDSMASNAAAETLREFVQTRKSVKIRTYNIDQDVAHAKRFQKVLKYFHVENADVPAVHSCRQLLLNIGDSAKLRRRLERLLTVTAFVRDGCPRCAASKTFLEKIKPRYPCFQFVQFEVTNDSAARERLQKLAKHYDKQALSLPAFYFCNQLTIGFDSEETTGRRLESILQAWTIPCPPEKTRNEGGTKENRRSSTRHPIAPAVFSIADQPDDSETDEETAPHQKLNEKEDRQEEDFPLPPLPAEGSDAIGITPTDDLLPILPEPHDLNLGNASERTPANNLEQDSMQVPFLGKLSQSRLGMPAFTFLVGLVDGFNPCAMWVLLFLLSVLVNLKNRTKILAVAGTFVAVSGLAYFAFMAAWLNILLFVGYLRSVQVTLGVTALVIGSIHIKDFLAFKKGITLSIPESAKPTIYARVRKIVSAENLTAAISCAIVLAVLVNIVELLCTAGLPALYSEILMLQKYPAWKNYAYLGLYNLAYMLDDLLMVSVVVVTLGRYKMQEREGRWLKLISGVAIAVLGTIMIFKPDWLV